MKTDDARLIRLIDFYETLTAERLPSLASVYAENALFKDPFNDVQGLEAIGGIFRHMFVQVDVPRFVVTSAMSQCDQAFLVWEFHFRMKRFSAGAQCIRGASHIRFDAVGRVASHRDYWDAAEELYEKLPLLGGFMRLLKRQAAH